MKKLLIAVCTVLFLASCANDSKGGKRVLSSSSGNINTLSVVVDNDLWEGSVGESIRSTLGAPVYGLPQEEPLFSLKQMPSSVFTGFARKGRIVFKVEKGKAADTKIYEDAYATPQKVVVVSGMNNQEIISQLEANADKIVNALKKQEITEKQRRIRKSLGKTDNIEATLGLNINFPSAYRIAKEDGKFFWVRRDIENGSINFMLYELPLDAVQNGEEAINDVIAIRDSIGKQYIPGPTDGTYMTTEEAYTPFIQSTILDNKPTLETKSTWHVKGAYMAGPFINYVIEDKVNNRLIVAEGFAYAPAVQKRDFVFELESIIRSIKIK